MLILKSDNLCLCRKNFRTGVFALVIFTVNLALGLLFTDPNDPRNADLNEVLKNAHLLANASYFRLDQMQEKFDFTTSDYISENKRFRILQLREKQAPEFANMKMIPPYEDEISAELFAKYRTRRSQEALSLLSGSDDHKNTYTLMLQNVGEQCHAENKLGNLRRIPASVSLVEKRSGSPSANFRQCTSEIMAVL